MTVSVKLSDETVESARQQAQKQFNAVRMKTRGYRFDREEANAC